MMRLNWKTIKGNITEAREELEQVEARLASKTISEGELQVSLEHAYFHLNFAGTLVGFDKTIRAPSRETQSLGEISQ